MKQPNYYYDKDKSLLILTDDNFKPYAAFSGNIGRQKYQEVKAQKLSITDIKAELEICRSVLLQGPEDMAADIRADYQRRYRIVKNMLRQAENQLIKQ
jgi:hypothetical protein